MYAKKMNSLLGCYTALAVCFLNACSQDKEAADSRFLSDTSSSSETPSSSDLLRGGPRNTSTGLSYTANAGSISPIKWGPHTLTTGGAYNVVLSCDGPDRQQTNGESRGGAGHFLTPAGGLPACGKIPYKMSFSGTGAIEASWTIGPFQSPTAIVSVSMDLDKSHFPDYEFSNSALPFSDVGCGYPVGGAWMRVFGISRGRYSTLSSSCFIEDQYPVALAKRPFSPGIELKARGFLADISRTVKSVEILDGARRPVSSDAARIAIQGAFYNHPGTNAVALEILPLTSSGRIPAGYSIVIKERIVAGPPSMLPKDLGPCGRLESGKGLARGQFLDSCNGKYRLSHQTDGNVALYRLPGLSVVWSTKTSGKATSEFVMQVDGNLVLYNGKKNSALFHTFTYGNPGALLLLQDDGNLVVYSGNNRALWQSGTRNQ